MIGPSASTIPQFEHGYFQNASATAAYAARIAKGQLAGHRGFGMTPEDRLRADVIAMLMCNFEIDLHALSENPLAAKLEPIHRRVLADFAGYVAMYEDHLEITKEGRPLTRIIAQRYDQFGDIAAQYSQAS